MTDLVAKVAMKLCCPTGCRVQTPWSSFQICQAHTYDGDARAAIEAALRDMMEPSAKMLAAALPFTKTAFSDADKRVGAEACLLLSAGKNIPNEGHAVISAAQLAVDFRAMVAAYAEENGFALKMKTEDLDIAQFGRALHERSKPS